MIRVHKRLGRSWLDFTCLCYADHPLQSFVLRDSRKKATLILDFNFQDWILKPLQSKKRGQLKPVEAMEVVEAMEAAEAMDAIEAAEVVKTTVTEAVWAMEAWL